MHILMVNNIYPPIVAGGADLIVTYLSEGLVRFGHRVSVVSTCGPEMEPYPDEIRNGVEVTRFFPSNVYWTHARQGQPRLKKWIWHVRDAWNMDAARRFERILQTHRPDVVHTHVIDGLSASIWATARAHGIPVIHTAHDYHLLCPRAFLLTADWRVCANPSMSCAAYRNWHMRTTRHVDLFVSPSQFLLDMHRRLGLAAKDHAVVRNGIPLPTGMPRPPRTEAGAQRSRFVLLSRLTTEKGIQTVLDAMEVLPREVPVELEIAGTGPLQDRVRTASQRDPRIRYLGFVTGAAKQELLSRTDFLILPSLWYENAPTVIAEAAAYGLGVIASEIGGIPEFVEPGRTGLLFPPGDGDALAAIMSRLAGERTLLSECRVDPDRAARRFDVAAMIGTYERHYLSLAGVQPDRLYATAAG